MPEPHVKLATALCTAVRIEPELIRAVRIEVFPELDVSAEADLWFSELVRSRGAHGIVFDEHEIANLRARLMSWLTARPASDPVHQIGDIIARVHERLTPALALEEHVTWLAVSGRDDKIDEALLPALRALVRENRTGVGDWFTAAWCRLPDSVRRSLTGWKLAQVVRLDRPGTSPLALVRGKVAGSDLADIVHLLPLARLLLRRRGNILELGDFEPTADTVGILIPDTDPRLLEVAGETMDVRRGASKKVAVPPGPVRVTTARGAAFEISSSRRPVNRFLGIETSAILALSGIRRPATGFQELQRALGDLYEPMLLRDPSKADVRTALQDLRTSHLNDGSVIVAWQGPVGPGRVAGMAVDEEDLSSYSGRDRIDLAEILDACIASGAAQVLCLLDLTSTNDANAETRKSRIVTRVMEASPRHLWVGVAAESMVSANRLLSARVGELLSGGPASDRGRALWSALGEHLTGDDLMRGLASEGWVEARFQGPGRQMFRNPLHTSQALEASRKLDIEPEVDMVLGWVRSGRPGLRVIVGSSGSGKSTIIEEFERRLRYSEIKDRIAVFHVGYVPVGEPSELRPSLEKLLMDTEPGVTDVIVLHDLHSRAAAIEMVRALLGLRPHAIIVVETDRLSFARDLSPAGPDLDLDDPLGHAVRRLSGSDARTIASFLVESQEMQRPLVARLAAQLRDVPVRTDTPGWQEQVLSALQRAVDMDLSRSPTARHLLLPLAWARGTGLPAIEWAACATALDADASVSYNAQRIGNALQGFECYVVADADRTYRIAHPTVASHLQRISGPQVPQQIVTGLISTVPTDGSASNYVRRNLSAHVMDGGEAGLAQLRLLAERDPRWSPNVAHTALLLAQKEAGARGVTLAREATTIWRRLAEADPTYADELSNSIALLRSLQNATPPATTAPRVTAPSRRTGEIRAHDMVVVVPGVNGNLLHGLDGRSVIAPPLPEDIGDEHPDDGVVPGRLTGAKYGKLLNHLNGLGYQQDRGNLLALPYDWRLSHRWTGQWLGIQVADALAQWRTLTSADAKVVFVCVSTGGLPTRWYVEKCGGAAITARMITIGCPNTGSTRALQQLVNGGPRRANAAFWRSLPSMYQTLPVYSCINVDGELRGVTDVDLPNLSSHRVADGTSFLNDIIAGYAPVSPIIGVAQTTPTTARIAHGRLRVTRTTEDGDGYVPMFSSAHAFGPNDPALLRVAERHNRLHQNDQVLEALGLLLSSRASTRPESAPSHAR